VRGNFNLDAILATALLVWATIACVATHSDTSTTTPSPASVSTSGNLSNDQLSAFTPGERALALGKIVDEKCVGKDAFYMGMGKDLSAYWSVRCLNGRSYEVEIHPDARGSTKVLDCRLLWTVAKVKCFKKLDEQ
jgi:hypothetical protein